METAKVNTAYELTTSGESVLNGEMETPTVLRFWTSLNRKDDNDMTKKSNDLLPPIHPGEILAEEFMKPLGLSINRVARDLRVPVTRIAEIVHGRRSVSSDTALRLARYLSTTPGFWMNLQSAYDLEVAEREGMERIARDVHPHDAVA